MHFTIWEIFSMFTNISITSLKRLKDPQIRKRNMNEDKKEIIKKKRKLITDWLKEYVIIDQPNYTR